MEGNKYAVVGLLLVLVGAGALVGLGAAQSTSPVVEVPGLDAGETGNITVAVDWNSNATTDDSATVEIDYVTNLSTGTLEQTDTHTINASPSNTTTETFEVAPAEDVEQFEVTTEAVQENVSDVNVTSNIEAPAGGGGGGTIGGETGTAVGGLLLAALIVGVLVRRKG